MSDEVRVEKLRESLPALGRGVYLNTGTAGPLPLAVSEAMLSAVRSSTAEARIGGAYYQASQGQKDRLRSGLSTLFGCESTQISLTHNTTEGMNFITLGVNWIAGDEAVTTNVEHPGALLPLWVVQERFGVTVRTADVAGRPGDAIAAIMEKVTHRTKLISMSHVSYSTGDVLPVAEVVAEAHKLGVLVLVDGAQSFCALPLNVDELGVDFYSVPGQKWLCGPEGTGALYSRQDSLSQIRATFASYGTVDGFNEYGGILIKEDGRRFEQGTMQPADLNGQEAACRFLIDDVGTDWAFDRIYTLAGGVIDELSEIPGVRVITDSNSHAGLVSFAIRGIEPDKVVAMLDEKKILVRSIRRPAAVRMSVGFFTTQEEIRLAITEIQSLARSVSGD